MKKFKRHRDYGFFDQDIRLTKLSTLGDPLERLDKGIDFEIFRELLILGLSKLAKGKGGRPPYDYVLLFKILILQRYYNLSDAQAEFQINDRMSFMRFLGLTMADDIPDSNTIWNFREQLTELGLVDQLFSRFINELSKLNLIVNEGKIVDASFIEVPIQRNTREENKAIKDGNIPASFKENSHKESQKDVDARWVTKNGEDIYGYKNHTKVDSKSKLITGYVVTDASVHDSQALDKLLNKSDNGETLWADSAYTGKEQEATIAKNEMKNEVCEKGYRGNPLTEEQQLSNRTKSKTRARVEHIYAFMEMNMNGMYLYAIGKKRITAMVGLINLTYNMFRKVQLLPC
jgi:IS5 family transposase